MPLMEDFRKSGLFLFRWRSYAPLAFFLVIFASLGYFQYPFQDHGFDLMWESFCLSVGALGIALRVLTVGFVPEGTSGRGTQRPSASRLNTTGMYSVVRNPLYLGNFLTYAAPVLFVRVWQVLLLYIAAFALYYERIIFAEESFLRQNFGETFNEWASRTPAFFPRLGNWIKPDLPFSWKMALSREYHGVLGLISSLFMMELVSDFYLTGEFLFDRFWVIALAMGMFFYLTVRLLDKKTSLLEAEKR